MMQNNLPIYGALLGRKRVDWHLSRVLLLAELRAVKEVAGESHNFSSVWRHSAFEVGFYDFSGGSKKTFKDERRFKRPSASFAPATVGFMLVDSN